MPTLRLTQHHLKDDDYRIDLTFDQYHTATVDVTFRLLPDDQERIRWYLEDYLEAPLDPLPKMAARIEQKMHAIGVDLFQKVFQGNDDARDLWATLRQQLHNTRIELVTGVQEAAAIPWELLRDPKTDVPLALRAQGFVRTYSTPAQPPTFPSSEGAGVGSLPIRILLVICRPGGRDDVAFRSVAMKILKGLNEEARKVFRLDVLRPPTFDQLSKTLRAAKEAGRPYHVVHFDGHGAFLDLDRLLKSMGKEISDDILELLMNFDPQRFAPQALYPDKPRAGKQGYLCFENPQISQNMRFVDGSVLGKLLVETDVPVLVLNACRSAHAEELIPQPPLLEREGEQDSPRPLEEGDSPAESIGMRADVHTQVRAFGSLAQEVMDTGVAGVVAMRYNVYVVTAAQFVADLYAALVRGNTLGEAVTFGRKQLQANPLREIAYDPIPLQDWIVPVVYESAPMSLFPTPSTPLRDLELNITLNAAESTPDAGGLDRELPKEPDVGFFGRDETLLTLERAFDNQNIVLLHAYAGSGKTATSAEFARWYTLTGGAQAVLFTSFERHQTLTQVLGKIEQMFGPLLEQNNIHFLALDAAQQRNVALQIMQQVPLLWIWDNVEPIAGFPAGSGSMWSDAEQRELAEFLRDCRGTRANMLLTSRRDERGWLGDLPCRAQIPHMPMRERVQLARGIAAKHNVRLNSVAAWQPLLQFTQGNPLTITVLVGQALRDGLTTDTQIKDFVDRLRAGAADFEDEAEEGRSKSLGASLQYGFGHAFSQTEHKKLALLHFFQGFVDVDALKAMGHPGAEWSLPDIQGMSKDDWIALLDRAAEIGLLTRMGRGYYTIHPALPWYFKSLFEQLYDLTPRPPLLKGEGEQDSPHPDPLPKGEGADSPRPPGEGPGVRASRAFVGAMGALGEYYAEQYEHSNREVIDALTLEEPNLLFARHLARQHGWWHRVTSAMQGLRQLYAHTGRRSEWRQLVDEIVPDFVDAATDGPLPDREERWSLVTEYRVRLAEEARQWAEAERLQRVCVEWDRQQAAEALTIAPDALSSTQRNRIRTLASSLHEMAEIRREIGKSDCVEAYEESLTLCERIGDQPVAAVNALNLGHAYMTLPNLRNLAQAEQWYRRSLELRADGDRLGQSKCYSQLGLVAYERFNDARAVDQPQDEELRQHLQAALDYYHKALNLIPQNAVHDLAVTHNQLGNIYDDAGDLERALFHYREDIRYDEMAGNLYGAGQTRYNVALALKDAGRLEDALLYAQAALRNFETFGDRAAEDIQDTQGLIDELQE